MDIFWVGEHVEVLEGRQFWKGQWKLCTLLPTTLPYVFST